METIKLSVIRNKKNGQMNVNLPKKKMPKAFSKSDFKIKHIKIKLEGWG